MTEQVKKKLEEEIKQLEYELTNELPAELKKRMGELAMMDLTNIPKDKIAFGSRVKVYDNGKDEEIEYKLVTSEETDVTKGLISTTSPIGRALMGKRVGDTATVVTPNGNREMEILKLSTIHDEA